MLDFNTVIEAFKHLQAIPSDQRGSFTIIFVATAFAYVVYYVVAGFVVLSLGRRLIQASFAAYKESRRERA